MKKIISIIALVLFTLAVSAQKSQKTHQVAKTEYEFILPQKPELEMEYPKDVRLDDNVQTYRRSRSHSQQRNPCMVGHIPKRAVGIVRYERNGRPHL